MWSLCPSEEEVIDWSLEFLGLFDHCSKSLYHSIDRLIAYFRGLGDILYTRSQQPNTRCHSSYLYYKQGDRVTHFVHMADSKWNTRDRHGLLMLLSWSPLHLFSSPKELLMLCCCCAPTTPIQWGMDMDESKHIHRIQPIDHTGWPHGSMQRADTSINRQPVDYKVNVLSSLAPDWLTAAPWLWLTLRKETEEGESRGALNNDYRPRIIATAEPW